MSFLAPVVARRAAGLRGDARRRSSTGAGSCRCACAPTTVDVALGEAVIDAPPTALIFPGQGIQRAGLGADGRARSRAARAVWARADAHTRARSGSRCSKSSRTTRASCGSRTGASLGIPTASCSGPSSPSRRWSRSPPRSSRSCARRARSATRRRRRAQRGRVRGAARARRARARGGAELVCAARARDAAPRPARRGRRLAVPARGRRSRSTGSPRRRRGRQPQRARPPVRDRRHGGRDRRARPRRRACVPGIDIPFHSSALRGAVDEFRPHVEAAGIDPTRCTAAGCRTCSRGRWSPATTWSSCSRGSSPRPCAGSRRQQALAGLVGALPRDRARARRGPDRPRAHDGAGRRGAARGARPRRGAGASGGVRPGGGARRGGRVRSRRIHARARRRRRVRARPQRRARRPRLADRPVDAGDALEFVLALQARVRLDQLDPSESVDELFQGVSSRRNQVLIDLGREFGLSGAEGVQRQTIGELVKALREQGAAYRFPGPYLKDALATGLDPRGRRRAATSGCRPGSTDHVFARVALDTRPGPSARGGDLARLSAGPDVLDRALALTVRRPRSVPLARPPRPKPVAAPVAVANPALEDALLDSARTLADALGRPFAPPGEPLLAADPDTDTPGRPRRRAGGRARRPRSPRASTPAATCASPRPGRAPAGTSSPPTTTRSPAGSTPTRSRAEIDRLAAHARRADGRGDRRLPRAARSPEFARARRAPQTRAGHLDVGGAARWPACGPPSRSTPTGVPRTGTEPDDARPIDLLRDRPTSSSRSSRCR